MNTRSMLSGPCRARLATPHLLAGAALCALLLGATTLSAQTTPTPGATAPVAPGPAVSATSADVDLAEAPEVAAMLRDEATHRDRMARIRRLREIASQGNQRERLAQLDDLERRERQRHEARVVRDRSQLSERSARGVDDIVRRGGAFRASGRDVSVARQRKFGTPDRGAIRRGTEAERSGDRAPERATRSTPTRSRTPARAPTRSGGRTGSTGTGSSGGRGPR